MEGELYHSSLYDIITFLIYQGLFLKVGMKVLAILGSCYIPHYSLTPLFLSLLCRRCRPEVFIHLTCCSTQSVRSMFYGTNIILPYYVSSSICCFVSNYSVAVPYHPCYYPVSSCLYYRAVIYVPTAYNQYNN